MSKIDRALGAHLAISVATAVPIETLLQSDISKGYNYIYLNIRTLYRNFHGSFLPDQIPSVNKMADMFTDEILTIKSIIAESVSPKLTPVLYIALNKSLGSTLPRAKIKKPTTNIQINYRSLEEKVIAKALTAFDEEEVYMFDNLIKGSNTSSLMLSHIPLDLMSAYTFRKLALLESHTGKLLDNKSMWIKKLSKNEDYVNLPFNLLTLQIIGDRNNQFLSQDKKVIDAYLKIANKNHWHSGTTLVKSKADIQRDKDKFLVAVFTEMANVTLK